MKQPKRRKRMDPNTILLIRKIMGGVLVLSLLALLIWGTWYVTRVQALTIQEVTVSGGETISHALVEDLVRYELEGEYIRLIPKKFFLFYPKDSIYTAVSGMDRIQEVIIERDTLTSLRLRFAEYVPDALWCTEDSKNCVFIDQQGFAFAKAPALTGGSFLRLDKLGVEPVTGIQAFSPETYSRIKDLVMLLEEQSWYVSKTAVDVVGDAYLALTDGGELKVALNDPAEQIVENLFTVLQSPEFVDIGPGDFEYIDLRFGNKVFVSEFGPESELATSTEIGLE